MRLYEECGFTPVEGYRGLALPLAPDEGGRSGSDPASPLLPARRV